MSCHTFRDGGFRITRATTEHMPFVGHRNCSQWGPHKAGFLGPEMSEMQSKRDAREGSANLEAAIKKAQAK